MSMGPGRLRSGNWTAVEMDFKSIMQMLGLVRGMAMRFRIELGGRGVSQAQGTAARYAGLMQPYWATRCGGKV